MNEHLVQVQRYFRDRDATIGRPRLREDQRLAAVLVLISPGENGPEVVLTRRSEDLSNHAGQISLPGGTVDESDRDHIETALREAREEIGLNTDALEVLGSLNWYVMPSGFVVLPVVGLLKSRQSLRPEPREVLEIFSIPLESVLDMALYQRESIIRNGIKREFYFFDFNGYYIWGATAGILRSLASELKY